MLGCLMLQISTLRFGLYCSLFGGVVAGSIAAFWYTPLVYDVEGFSDILTQVSIVLWPTARLVGGWVGPWNATTYWARVSFSIVANAALYGVAGSIAMAALKRMRVQRH